MNSGTAIHIHQLGKQYRLGQSVDLTRTFREMLAGLPHLINRRSGMTPPADFFWALRDVNFSIEQGQVLGVVGRNGAGKSTLLKILSRITTPTTGQVTLHGRVGSLLEVGTGFHSELTGRENIYLNGVILGMRKAEINKKFDEIVAFSEVGPFLDTPVKRYSSGMNVRLAFAVAAHLEPEILLVDEVLAVGDAAFQKKCLGKMQNVANEGRTILFVSHNMCAVRQLCTSCLWIDRGKIKQYGEPSSVVEAYLKAGNNSQKTAETVFDEDTTKQFQLRIARLRNHQGIITQNFDCDMPVYLELQCQVYHRIPGLYGYLSISRKDGTVVMISDSFDIGKNPLDDLPVGVHLVRITVPARTLGAGDYDVFINFTSRFGQRGFNVDSPGVICTFTLDDFTSNRGNLRGGFFSTLLPWDVSRI